MHDVKRYQSLLSPPTFWNVRKVFFSDVAPGHTLANVFSSMIHPGAAMKTYPPSDCAHADHLRGGCTLGK